MNRIYTLGYDDKLDFVFDWSRWLTRINDTIATVTFTAETGLTIDSSTSNSTSATAWARLTPGSTSRGRALTLRCRIVTAAGRIRNHAIQIQAAT